MDIGCCVNCVKPIYGDGFIEPRSGYVFCTKCAEDGGRHLMGPKPKPRTPSEILRRVA